MKNKLRIAEVQKNLNEVIEQLKQNGGYVEVVKNHHTAAVILSIVDFKRLERFLPKSVPSKKREKGDWKLAGSMELAEDFDEFASEPSKLILESIAKQKL